MAMTLRPDPEMDAALRKLAAHYRAPHSEVIRRTVLEAAQRVEEDERVHTLYQEVAASRRDALDRLSDS
jgi:predicted transcriptional regulator